MPDKPYLLLDAGGTVLFIDQVYLSEAMSGLGFPVDARSVHDQHFRTIHWFDSYIRTHRRYPPKLGMPYVQFLLQSMGVPDDLAVRAAEAAEARHEQVNLWTFTFPWIVETLDQLRDAGCRMSVVSNADGRVEQQLRDVGLLGYFETIVDSTVVGVNKPDPAIYELTLADLALLPGEALFIGDTFYVDIWGANRIGLPGLHLDPLGLYGGWPGEHIADLRQLPDWLGIQGTRERSDRRGGLTVQADHGSAQRDLFPLQDFSLAADDGQS